MIPYGLDGFVRRRWGFKGTGSKKIQHGDTRSAPLVAIMSLGHWPGMAPHRALSVSALYHELGTELAKYLGKDLDEN